MSYPMNPTDKAHWMAVAEHPQRVPHDGAARGATVPWSQALGPDALLVDVPGRTRRRACRASTPPDVWFVYRTNPAISFWDTAAVGDKMAHFPFVVAFAYTRDETNHFADVLLPDATDLESLQLIRIGGTKYVEQFWDHQGFALRQPAVRRRGRRARFHRHRDRARAAHRPARPSTTRRSTGARPACRCKSAHGDFSLDVEQRAHARSDLGRGVPRRERRTHRRRRSARPRLVQGARPRDQAVPAHRLVPVPDPGRAAACASSCRTRSACARVGAELGRRLHEHDMHWWDRSSTNTRRCPSGKDFAALWEAAVSDGGRRAGGLSVLAADRAQHAICLGRQRRHAADQGSRRQRRRATAA